MNNLVVGKKNEIQPTGEERSLASVMRQLPTSEKREQACLVQAGARPQCAHHTAHTPVHMGSRKTAKQNEHVN